MQCVAVLYIYIYTHTTTCAVLRIVWSQWCLECGAVVVGCSMLQSDPLHRCEFGPPKFFSKTFKFSIIFCSTLHIPGGGPISKSMQIQKEDSKPSEITCQQSEPARTISKMEERREFVPGLCHEQSPMNSFKRLYTVKGLLVLVGNASFLKEFRCKFHSGGEGYTYIYIYACIHANFSNRHEIEMFGILLPIIALQCGTVRCSVLPCVAVCCSVLQCVAVKRILQSRDRFRRHDDEMFCMCCSVLQCIDLGCSVLQCGALCYSDVYVIYALTGMKMRCWMTRYIYLIPRESVWEEGGVDLIGIGTSVHRVEGGWTIGEGGMVPCLISCSHLLLQLAPGGLQCFMMCRDVLWCVAVCCIVFQCVAVGRKVVLFPLAFCFFLLQLATCVNTSMRCVAVCCGVYAYNSYTYICIYV